MTYLQLLSVPAVFTLGWIIVELVRELVRPLQVNPRWHYGVLLVPVVALEVALMWYWVGIFAPKM